jgi:hypothetical protein
MNTSSNFLLDIIFTLFYQYLFVHNRLNVSCLLLSATKQNSKRKRGSGATRKRRSEAQIYQGYDGDLQKVKSKANNYILVGKKLYFSD